jgi:hypothetical protein
MTEVRFFRAGAIYDMKQHGGNITLLRQARGGEKDVTQRSQAC